MRTNLLPAILIAGPSHSGKSVLSFLLTWKLREMGIAHYLLRAAPDGEGDWYHLGKSGLVRALRQEHKGEYSPEFVTNIRNIIDNRLLPLLVDVGGRPQGEQFGILKDCTHSILLYCNEDQQVEWDSYLADMDLLPVAGLRSDLEGEEIISEAHPVLQGIISGLDRHNWKTGVTFGALLDRVAGICHYDEAQLEQIHTQKAPYPVLSERQMAETLELVQPGKRLFWEPGHLPRIQQIISVEGPRAVYGRGPVWLAGMLAAHHAPVPLAFFDARYGWLITPEVTFEKPENVNVQIRYNESFTAYWLEFTLGDVEVEPGEICLPTLPIEKDRGLILSGGLPRWYFAALTRALMPQCAWIAIDDPASNRTIRVYNHIAPQKIGCVFSRW